MDELEIYNVSLKNIKENETFCFKLADDFFSAVESTDVQGGLIDATLTVTKKTMFFEFLFHLHGSIQVACDRCLELMSLPINTEKTFFVKIGEEYCDNGDDTIVVSSESEELNVAWLLYEMIALAIPIQHKHREGECEKTMEKCLQACLVDETDTSERKNEDKATTDPRWDRLKSILDNN